VTQAENIFSTDGNKMSGPLYGDFRMKHILLLLLLYAPIASVPINSASGIHSPQAAPTNCASELRAAMHRMHDAAAKIAATSNADEDFVRLMLPHHQAAIEMAQTQLLCGKDPELRRVAQEIITDQQAEIDLMRLWLKKHHTSRTEHSRDGHHPR
jgi:hypothetical protein